MIPLEKLIEYKGNRYELTKAMIELARKGKDLLRSETKYKKEKYIPIVISNILEGKIKFGYEDENSVIDEHAPFLTATEEYDEIIYEDKLSEESENESESISSTPEDEYNDFDDDDIDDDEKSKTTRASKKTKS